MVDPLSLLRHYNVNKKEIIERDNQIIFGEFSWPKNVKTNYLMWGSGKDGAPKEYYTLESLLFLLKNFSLNHPVYVRQAVAESIPVVRRPIKKDLLAYLNGETASSASIDKYAPPAMPAQMKRSAEDTLQSTAKKPQFEETRVLKVEDRLAARIDAPRRTFATSNNINIHDKLHRRVNKCIADSMAQGFQAHQSLIEDSVRSVVQSRSVTPAPQVLESQMKQSQILQHIKQGFINAAFHEALSAENLSMVMFVCERVNPEQVFSQSPCPLRQNVLLSLIQQLCADMSNYNEITHTYLQEAVISLDPTDRITRAHMPTVLGKLIHQLDLYIVHNPNNKLTRGAKIVCMAAESLLSKV